MKGHLFVISGPSGVGKTVIMDRLRKRIPELGRIITYTTREERPGEKNGVHYHFVDEATFRQMVAENDFLEWAQVHAHHYGTPKSDTLKRLDAGEHIGLIVDVQGALNIKKQMPEAVLIFIEPESIDSLEKHLRLRKGMDEADIQRRLTNSRKELEKRTLYDYDVINREGHIDETVRNIAKIIESHG